MWFEGSLTEFSDFHLQHHRRLAGKRLCPRTRLVLSLRITQATFTRPVTRLVSGTLNLAVQPAGAARIANITSDPSGQNFTITIQVGRLLRARYRSG